MERVIGDVFFYGNKEYMIEKAIDRACTGCAMDGLKDVSDTDLGCEAVGECEDIMRTDNTEVIAVEMTE